MKRFDTTGTTTTRFPGRAATGETTMKRFWMENDTVFEEENGRYVLWSDHTAALFQQGKQHIEELVVFSGEIERLKSEHFEHDVEIARLNEECISRFNRIKGRDAEIKAHKRSIEERDKIIEERDIEIAEYVSVEAQIKFLRSKLKELL